MAPKPCLAAETCSTCHQAQRAFIVYMLAVIVSGAFSAYPRFVFGYLVLLAGTGLLLAGLVSSSLSRESLGGIEKLILVTLAVMLLKDTIIDVFFRNVFLQDVVLREDYVGEELHRLGTGTTSANSMAMSAALAFWMSFGRRSKGFAHVSWRCFWRGLCIAVILLARSRIALIGILIGSILRPWFAFRLSPAMNSHALRLAIPCFIGSIVIATALAWLMGLPMAADAVDFVNRSQDSASILSVTGRTEIWPDAIEKIFNGPRSIALGYGYGVSRFVLNNGTRTFFAYHAHNTFLEVVLGAGLLGALPFFVLMGYSLRWLARFSELCLTFSAGFALRAIAVIVAILSSTLTEADLATKIGPILIVYMFYVLSLDRHAAFLRAGAIEAEYASQTI